MYQRFRRTLIALTLVSLSVLLTAVVWADETIRTDDFSDWRQPATGWITVGDVQLDELNAKRLVAVAGRGVIFRGEVARGDYLISKDEFSDITLHIEFNIPQGSNSGVYFMGRYEIQVYDSYGVEKDAYPGIECGGIYPRHSEARGEFEGYSPRVNASLPPGQWQSFDVTFRAPRFDESGNKIANARFEKVVHNGKVIHEDVEVTGMTRAGMSDQETPTGPIRLQGDHGPVAYRNIRVRRLTD